MSKSFYLGMFGWILGYITAGFLVEFLKMLPFLIVCGLAPFVIYYFSLERKEEQG